MNPAPASDSPPLDAFAAPDASKPAAPLLEAVLAHSTPQAGQVVLGELSTLPGPGNSLAQVQVSGLGAVRIAASLVPLSEADCHQRVALSLLPDGQALLLGKLWDGASLMPTPTKLSIDGQVHAHHIIEAEHSIELRCGESAIVLLADGRIQLRGTYITSHASATQRIVGGSVHVN